MNNFFQTHSKSLSCDQFPPGFVDKVNGIIRYHGFSLLTRGPEDVRNKESWLYFGSFILV